MTRWVAFASFAASRGRSVTNRVKHCESTRDLFEAGAHSETLGLADRRWLRRQFFVFPGTLHIAEAAELVKI